MKSRTSYFSPTVFRKDLTRFAPVWALYGVGLLLTLIAVRDITLDFFTDSLGVFAWIHLFYGMIVAQVLFGDLYQSRMCNPLHAMPLRRECWFFTHLAAGLVFFLLPTVPFAALGWVMTGSQPMVVPMWLLGNLLEYLFFFGVSVLSAFSAGNRFAMALIYGLINALSMIAEYLAEFLLEPLLYGVTLPTRPFYQLCPALEMARNGYFTTASYLVNNSQRVVEVHLASGGWSYLAICALVGLAGMALALYLYRWRKLECAGDFIVVKALEPVFLVVYSLSMGVTVSLFFTAFGLLGLYTVTGMIMLFVGLGVGFYTGRMLLKRTVKVFQPRSLAGLAALSAALALTIGVTRLDPVGITRRVPERSQVTAVAIQNSQRVAFVPDDQWTSSPEAIDAAIALHKAALEYRPLLAYYDLDSIFNFTLTYALENGTQLTRSYFIPSSDPAFQGIVKPWSDCRLVLGFAPEELDQALADITDLSVGGYPIDRPEEIRGILEALIQDCQDGNLCQFSPMTFDTRVMLWIGWDSDREPSLDPGAVISGTDGGYSMYKYVDIGPECKHTMEWFRANGYLDEDGYFQDPHYMEDPEDVSQ